MIKEVALALLSLCAPGIQALRRFRGRVVQAMPERTVPTLPAAPDLPSRVGLGNLCPAFDD